MARVEQEIDLIALQEDVQASYDIWAPEHADGKLLTVRPFDPNEAYQKIENVRIEPQPDVELAHRFGEDGTGSAAYDKLSTGFEEFKVIRSGMDRAKKHRSSLVATLHLHNVLDTPITHNNFYVTAGGDTSVAEINDVIANPMMCRINIGGKAVYEVLSASGSVDLALPLRGAKEHGMGRPARRYLGKRMGDALDSRLRDGVVMHWALSSTRGKPIILEDGSTATSVKRVDRNIADLVVELTPFVVPTPMVAEPGDATVEVLEPRTIRTARGVHDMMQEMVYVASELAGEKIYYGLPKGAHDVQV